MVAGTKDAVLMVESEASGLTEKVMLDAVKFGHEQFGPVIKMINEFAAECKKETADFISVEKRLLRPLNFMEGTPGSGCEIYPLKNNKRVAVINIMGNVYMKKADDVFNCISLKLQSLKLSKDVDFIIVDIHAEITSEKMAMGHYLDGQVTLVVGTHSHVPTYDFRILNHGTAYQTDAGMCGDYDSVIGMNKDAALKKFLKQPNLERLSPALGKGTLSGIKVIADEKTGKRP